MEFYTAQEFHDTVMTLLDGIYESAVSVEEGHYRFVGQIRVACDSDWHLEEEYEQG